MNFLTNLAKGFVRSAVNQVGKDTGKIISNKIYGDAHATPIRGVRHENGIYYNESDKILSEHEFRHIIHSQGYRRKYFNTNLAAKLWGFFLGLSATMIIHYYWGQYYAIIPSVILIICGIGTIFGGNGNMIITSKQDTPVFKTDLRYKEGKRFAEYKESILEQEIPSTNGYKNAKKVIGVTYILLAIYMYTSSLYVYSLEESFSWHIYGKIILPAFGIIILLHLIYRE